MNLSSLIASLLLVAPATQQAERIGDFYYVHEVDPITDEDASYIYTEELEASLTRTGRLVWRLSGGSVELFLSADEYLGFSGDPCNVIVRFDRDEARPRVQWQASTTGNAVFANGGQVMAFTVGALPASRVIVRIEDRLGTPHTYIFSLSGLTRALQQLGVLDRFQFEPLVRGPDQSFSIHRRFTTLGADASYIFVETESQRDGKATLSWRCEYDAQLSASTRVYLVVEKKFTFPDYSLADVIWFVDDAPPSEVARWYPLPSAQLELKSDQPTADLLTTACLKGQVLTVTFWDSSSEEHSFVFEVRGLAEALTRLPCAANLEIPPPQ